MLLTRIRMTRPYMGHGEGARLEVDVKTAEDFIAKGVAEADEAPIEPSGAEFQKAVEDARTQILAEASAEVEKRAKDMLDEELKKLVDEDGNLKLTDGQGKVKSMLAAHIRVHERQRDDPKLGFKSIGEFGRCVYGVGAFRDPTDERLRLAKQMSIEIADGFKAAGSDELQTGVDPYGGYLVPTEFSNQVLQVPHDSPTLIGRVRQVPMATDSLDLPAIDETSLAQGSLFGGITVGMRSETEQMTGTRPKFRNVHLGLNELYAMVYVTERLLKKSAVSLDLWLNQALPEAIRWKLDDLIYAGTGAGAPLGMLNANALVSVAKEAGQAATTLVTENIVKIWSRMYGAYRSNAVWLYNQDAEPQLLTMTLNVGTGGGPVFLPMGGLSAAPFNTILGRPAFPFAHCKTLGTVGDIMFVDPNQYLLGRETGSEFTAATSMHLRFDYAQVAFRVQMMIDGQPWWTTTMTPAQGSNTQSPFVALATRA